MSNIVINKRQTTIKIVLTLVYAFGLAESALFFPLTTIFYILFRCIIKIITIITIIINHKTIIAMDLQTITSLMLSADYKDRMKAEYYHLQNRKENLEAVLKLWDSGKLPFTPDCPRSIYDLQLRAMNDYMAVLEARAKIEKVIL